MQVERAGSKEEGRGQNRSFYFHVGSGCLGRRERQVAVTQLSEEALFCVTTMRLTCRSPQGAPKHQLNQSSRNHGDQWLIQLQTRMAVKMVFHD
ncbi:Hypothetical predicted protein [Podarcis lilfordi]|uniref:Uncharacterized protein n=1 Tax=Podarcis lilfordi TaxID=74358 RepID=A0AA35KLK2_9SAUR|nr:Hypothetical predicted protein [Podarcis lilfordi]